MKTLILTAAILASSTAYAGNDMMDTAFANNSSGVNDTTYDFSQHGRGRSTAQGSGKFSFAMSFEGRGEGDMNASSKSYTEGHMVNNGVNISDSFTD